MTSVTGLGEFSPIRRLPSFWTVILIVAKSFDYYFSTQKYVFFTKYELSYFWGDFFTPDGDPIGQIFTHWEIV
jgi:hypothetical protein